MLETLSPRPLSGGGALCALTACLVVASCVGELDGEPTIPEAPPIGSPNVPEPPEAPESPEPPGTPPPPAEPPTPPTTPDPGGSERPAPIAGTGILGCPSVDLPPYTLGAPSARASEGLLSEAFSNSCASCHGAQGSGRRIEGGSYPEIPGGLTLDEYRTVVRQGRGNMPAFSDTFISEGELRSDFAALSMLNGDANPTAATEWDWTEAEVEEAYRVGMDAWRMPDHEGIACANCHSPDGLDLAVIGYTDDAILRRSGLHIPPELAIDVVNLIHAQRRRFNITAPCSRDWRPLQPGGEVLTESADPDEQDLAYANELASRNLRLVTGRVETVEDARALFDETASTNLREIPMAIPLPRWTEDTFNGEEHSTINDYLMGVGRVPNAPEDWYRLEDRYIDDPSDENFHEMLYRSTAESNDMGFARSVEDLARAMNGRCNKISRRGGLMTFTDELKRRSLLIVQHYFRMAVLGRPGWLEEPGVPRLGYARTYGEAVNPFYTLGAQFAEFGCGNAGPMFDAWPDEPAEEIPPADRLSGSATTILQQLNHPWQTLGLLYDPSLLMQEDFLDSGQNLHYWAINGFDQKKVHLPIMYFHKLAVWEHYTSEQRGTPQHPNVESNFFGQVSVPPLLDGSRLRFRNHTDLVVEEEGQLGEVANSIRCNGIRAVLLLQRELLLNGEPGYYLYRHKNQVPNMLSHYAKWAQFARRLERRGGPLNQAYAGRESLCTTELAALVSEVERLARGAEDHAPQ